MEESDQERQNSLEMEIPQSGAGKLEDHIISRKSLKGIEGSAMNMSKSAEKLRRLGSETRMNKSIDFGKDSKQAEIKPAKKLEQTKKGLIEKSDSTLNWMRKRINKELLDTKKARMELKKGSVGSELKVNDEEKGKQSKLQVQNMYRELEASFNLLYSADVTKKPQSKFSDWTPKKSTTQTQPKKHAPKYSTHLHIQNRSGKQFEETRNSSNIDTDFDEHSNTALNKDHQSSSTITTSRQLTREMTDKDTDKIARWSESDQHHLSLCKPSGCKNIIQRNKDMLLNIKGERPQTIREKSNLIVSTSMSTAKFASNAISGKPFLKLGSSETIQSSSGKTKVKVKEFLRASPEIKLAAGKTPTAKTSNFSNSIVDTNGANQDSSILLQKSVSNRSVKAQPGVLSFSQMKKRNRPLFTQPAERKGKAENPKEPLRRLESQSFTGSTGFPCPLSKDKFTSSFYKLVFFKEEREKILSSHVNGFLTESIRQLKDLNNRFPSGVLPPDRTVNLPKKDPTSRVFLPQRNIQFCSTWTRHWCITRCSTQKRKPTSSP
jgi:hypothetical protein